MLKPAFNETRLILYVNGYYELDADTSAKISQDELEEQMIQLENEKGEFINIDESLKKTLNSILDIISLTPPSAYRVESNYTGLYNDTRNLRATIGEYEENHFNSDFDTIEEMISGLSQIIKEQTRKEDITITNYKVGAIAKIPAYKTLLDIYTKQQSYLNGSSEELAKAIVNYNKHQQIIEEEMSIKQRKIEGSLQTTGGIVSVIAGTTLIIATAGLATPIVVGAVTVGSCSTMYGLSNSIEGAQNIYYGFSDDGTSVAVNPIKDSIFISNPELYYKIGNTSTIIASIGSPAAKSATLKTMTNRQIAVETGKRIVSGSAGSKVSSIAMEKHD